MTTNIKASLGLLLALLVAGAFAVASAAGSTSPRSGELHVTKECSQYFGQAGQFCTITSSNLNAIRPGTNVVYASAAGATSLNSDLVLDGPGNNNANGHVTLNFLTATGAVSFSGGTGQYSGFHANVVVTYNPTDGLWHWDGTLQLHPARPQRLTDRTFTLVGPAGDAAYPQPAVAMHGNAPSQVSRPPTSSPSRLVGLAGQVR